MFFYLFTSISFSMPKTILSEICCNPNILYNSLYFGKNMFTPNSFCPQKYFSGKNYYFPKNIFTPKLLFFPKIFLRQNRFYAKIVFTPKLFCFAKEKKILAKNISTPKKKNFGQKYFYAKHKIIFSKNRKKCG